MKKQDGSFSFVKITNAPYPANLHQEAGDAGLVPRLHQDKGRFPGGQYLVEMEYLDPEDGWISLESFAGDWEEARPILHALLEGWHACCNHKAVHGDLRAPNIALR